MDTLRTDDLVVPQGTTYAFAWPLLDKAGDPLDVAGYTARCQFRARVSSADTLAEFTVENGGIALDAGTLTLIFTPAASTAWEWRTARYDIELVSAAGAVSRITGGSVSLSPEVTR